MKPDGSEYVRKRSGKSNLAPKQKVVFPGPFADTKPDRFWLCKTEKSGEECHLLVNLGATCRLKGKRGFWRIIPEGSRDIGECAPRG